MRKLPTVEHSESNLFCICTPITPVGEIAAYKWATYIDRNSIHHWYDDFYIVPSSNAQMSCSTWLNIYISRHWLSFNDFLLWQQSCWIVVPLQSCTCPVGLKIYTCKHSVGLGIVFNLYQVNDKTRVEPLGKRRGKGRPKKVNTAYLK